MIWLTLYWVVAMGFILHTVFWLEKHAIPGTTTFVKYSAAVIVGTFWPVAIVSLTLRRLSDG